ncbi:RNA 2',3'-cyclic phosphodiesterase [Candidatus Bathyarchaeota archaeon]|nr:RNA 2',3'-cyclic phosphodiesterase [Candidatus Bathyarchaeota archaeon]
MTRNESGRIRSFIAFDIEEEGVLSQISSIQRELLATRGDLRIVEPKNIHITIRFLGELEAKRLEAVTEAMKKVRFRPFDVELKGLGAFDNINHIRVIWIGMGRGSKEASEIFDILEPKLRLLGIEPETRGFSPHLTIARVKIPRRNEALKDLILRNSDKLFGVVRAEALRLKRSILTPRGPIYTTIAEVRGTPN